MFGNYVWVWSIKGLATSCWSDHASYYAEGKVCPHPLLYPKTNQCAWEIMSMPGGLKPAAPADAEVQSVADAVSPYHAFI